MRLHSIGKVSTSHPMAAFGRCPLDFESGDLDVQVNQAGMENLPGVTYSKCHTSLLKGQEKGSVSGGQTHLPSCPQHFG